MEPLPAEMPTPDDQPAAAPSFGDTFWGGFAQALFPNLKLDSLEPKQAPSQQTIKVEVSPLPLPVAVELPSPQPGPAGSTSFGTFTGGMTPPPLPLAMPREQDQVAAPAAAPTLNFPTIAPREVPAFAIPDVTPFASPSMESEPIAPPGVARGADLLGMLGNRESRDAMEKLIDAMEGLTDQIKKQPVAPQQPGHQQGGGFVPLGVPPASAGAGTPQPTAIRRGMPPASSGLPSPWERVVRRG